MFQKILTCGIAVLFVSASAMAAGARPAEVRPEKDKRVEEKEKEKGKDTRDLRGETGRTAKELERAKLIGTKELDLSVTKGAESRGATLDDVIAAPKSEKKSPKEAFRAVDKRDTPAQAKERKKLFEMAKAETATSDMARIINVFGKDTALRVAELQGRKFEGVKEVATILAGRVESGRTERAKAQEAIDRVIDSPKKLNGVLLIGAKSAECLSRFRDEPINNYLDHIIEGLKKGNSAETVFDAMKELREKRFGEKEREAELALCELTRSCGAFNPAAMGKVCSARGI